MGDPLPAFDLAALHRAVDERRRTEGLSWAGLARAVSAPFTELPGTRAMAVSTIRRWADAPSAEGDGVLQALRWLGRSPESFVAGHPLARADETLLPDPGSGRILRWDASALHRSLDEARRTSDLTWAEVATAIGVTTPTLTGLARTQRVSVPDAVRLTTWLARPAAAFTRRSAW
jgi:hypothetical protein